MDRTLAKAVVDYTSAFETHSALEGTAFVELQQTLSAAGTDEIIEQNNMLSTQQLWHPPTINLFYNELWKRLDENTSYRLAVAYAKRWTPERVNVAITLGDHLPPPVPVDGWIGQEGNTVEIVPPRYKMQTLSTIMNGGDAIVEMDNGKPIDIVGVSGFPTDAVYTWKKATTSVTVPIDLHVSPDWRILFDIYQGLRHGSPVVSDPRHDVLINQMIDLPLANKINEIGGITHNGHGWVEIDAVYPNATSSSNCT